MDATRASKQLENEMEVFERRKLEDIKVLHTLYGVVCECIFQYK